MNKIIVQLPSNRDFAGRLELQDAAGKRLAGPFAVCGRADDETALSNKNPGRDPLLPFGDIPFGEYQVVKILPSGAGTAYAAEEYGSAGIVLMRPKLGDAALADANGRFGFFIQGGTRTRKGELRPTVDGSLRLSDSDQRKFIGAVRKLGDIQCFCLVVATAKLGAKVAVAKTSPERSGKSKRASLVLASGVIASTVTGTIRQAWIRTMLHGAGTAMAAGAAFVAVEHASGQNAGDYDPGNHSAMDQLNAVEHQSQEAAHATSDEEAHVKASQGFDTSTTTAPPPVDLHDKEGVVDPNAASGEQPSASDAGMAPGGPIPIPEQPVSTTEAQPETTPDNNAQSPMTEPEPQTTTPPEATPTTAPVVKSQTTEAQPAPTPEPANNVTPEPQAESMPENNAQPAAQSEPQPVTPEVVPTSTEPTPLPAPSTTQENTAVTPNPSSTPETTAPVTEPQPTPAPEPASQAIMEHDTANPQPTPATQVEPTTEKSFADGVKSSLDAFESANPDTKGKAYFSEGGGSRTADQQVAIILDSKNDANYPNIKARFKEQFDLETLPSYDNLTPEQSTWLVNEVNKQAGKPGGFAHVGGNAQDISVKNLSLDEKNTLLKKLNDDGFNVLKEKYSAGKSTFGVDVEDANVFHVYKK